MNRHRGRERRLHPRLEETLPVKISANGYDFSTTTQNISCVGAYCCISKYIPPFTKLALKIALPAVPQKKIEVTVECKGVIVRTEDEPNGGFNIAIFFNEIAEPQKEKIAHYINRSISLVPSQN